MLRLTTCLVLLLSQLALAENWPAWRGADGTGISSEKNLPETWAKDKNIKWKLALPAAGNSTPIIWGDQVFLTQGEDGGSKRSLIAVDRRTGEIQWTESVACDTEETTHRQNPPCSASPITDGAAVYANFASGGVLACTLDGKRLWHRNLGPVLSRWGNGGSPVLYGEQLIVFHGPGTPSILYSLNKKTGETLWETAETPINSPIFGSWSTPVVLKVGKRDQLVMPLPGDEIKSPGYFKGYDPDSGKVLWKVDGLGNEIYAMPIIGQSKNIVVGVSGHNGPTMAIRPGGKGNATKTNLLWRTEKKNPQRVGSGIIHDGLLYLADATGIIQCLDVQSGEVIFRERLGGNLWGSILLADGKLHVSNLEGDTFVIKAGRTFQLISKNSIGEATYAAMSVSQGELFLRTYEHLYCISNK